MTRLTIDQQEAAPRLDEMTSHDWLMNEMTKMDAHQHALTGQTHTHAHTHAQTHV